MCWAAFVALPKSAAKGRGCGAWGMIDLAELASSCVRAHPAPACSIGMGCIDWHTTAQAAVVMVQRISLSTKRGHFTADCGPAGSPWLLLTPMSSSNSGLAHCPSTTLVGYILIPSSSCLHSLAHSSNHVRMSETANWKMLLPISDTCTRKP